LVSFDKRPRAVPSALIYDLATRCDADGVLRPAPVLKAGSAVEILSGPFANFVATVETITPDQRVWVLLDLMGQQTRVQVANNHVRATG